MAALVSPTRQLLWLHLSLALILWSFCFSFFSQGKWDFTPSAKTKKTKADSSGQRRGGFGNTHVNGSRGGASSRRGGQYM